MSQPEPPFDRTLSKRESRLVLELEWRGQKTVTLDEIRGLLGTSSGYARFLAHRLARKGWLERLRSGLYQLIPAERGPDAVPDMHPLSLASALVEPYFYSFGTACTHHGFTEQVFGELYIACRERRPPELIRGRRYVFVYVPEQCFFGFEETKVLGQTVSMASPERALLDAIDRPRYAGGIGEVSRIVRKAAPKVSWKRLAALAERWGESALLQRLGYLLELHGLLPELRERLVRSIRPGSKVHLWRRVGGRLVRPWNVVANVPQELLVEKGEERLRRLVRRPLHGGRDR